MEKRRGKQEEAGVRRGRGQNNTQRERAVRIAKQNNSERAAAIRIPAPFLSSMRLSSYEGLDLGNEMPLATL
jgi:hypothetical protein